jgi:hypothetical protein
MKRISYFIFLLIGESTLAQTPSWEWANHAGGSGTDNALSLVTDSNGNSYVAAAFSNSIQFANSTITSAGNQDILILKYDSAGNEVWAQKAGGGQLDQAYDICLDPSGNILVTGIFRSAVISFDSTTLNNPAPGSAEIFLVKFDSLGNVVWAESPTGNNDDYGEGVSTDSSGNIYITGYFSNYGISFDTISLTSLGQSDMFIAKYSPAGQVIWAKRAGNTQDETAYDISTDGNGNSFVTGAFQSNNVVFGSDTVFLTASSGGPHSDVFVVKYDSVGNAIWANSGIGWSWDFAYGVAHDQNGNCFITGTFQSPYLSFGNTNLSCSGSWEVFVTKYDSTGNLVWARSAGGGGNDYANAVYADNYGNCFVVGQSTGTYMTFPNSSITAYGPMYMYVVKYDTLGNVLWVKRPSNNSSASQGFGVSADAQGKIYIGGEYSQNIIFNSAMQSFGSNDIFIAKIDDTSLLTGLSTLYNSTYLYPYPNPFSETVTIVIPEQMVQEQMFFIVYNALGQEVKKEEVNFTQIKIGNGELPHGIYLYRLVQNEMEIAAGILVAE